MPIGSTITAANQPNPGGTVSASVPSTAFGGTDYSGGTLSSIRISSFPTYTTTITINGITYTSASFPGVGVTVPSNALGQPSQAISVDPIDGIVDVNITYKVIDNAGKEGTTSGQAIIPFKGVVTGTVYNDVNGLNGSPSNTVNGTGIGSPSSSTPITQLYANLVNTATGLVEATVAVAANGTYTLPVNANGTYTVQVSTNAGTIGATPPAITLPAGWVQTGENLGAGAGNDGTVNGILSFTNSAGVHSITAANFGIEQLPTVSSITTANQINPGGTLDLTVPASNFGGADPNGGTITSLRISAFLANANKITINSISYTSATFPGGVMVPTNAGGQPTQIVLVDPVDGIVNVTIPYFVTDNAGKESLISGVATLPTSALLSGNVYLDANGLTNSRVDGIVIGNQFSTEPIAQLYAILINNGTSLIVASVPVKSNGSYQFTINSIISYRIQLNATAGTIGAAASSAATLPTGWVNVGEYVGTTAGNDGIVNGLIDVNYPANQNTVINVNFAIERVPDATPASYSIPHPLWHDVRSLTSTFGMNTLQGSDPEDGLFGPGGTFKINSIAEMNGNILFYDANNDNVYNVAEALGINSVIANYNPDKLKVYFIGLGSTYFAFNFVIADAAGVYAPSSARYTASWDWVLPIKLLSFNATKMNEASAMIEWTTGMEKDNDYFEVERSIDGNTWSSIGQVKSLGESTQQQSYSLIDNNPSIGVNYYRLKQVDIVGAMNYSEIKAVTFNQINTSNDIKIYPNPTSSIAYYDLGNYHESVELQIMDGLGRTVVRRHIAKGDNQSSIDVSSLSRGTYLLLFKGTNLNETKKLVVE